MASIEEPKANLAELAKRLRSVAQALRGLRVDNPQVPEELDALSNEIRAVSAQIRRM